MQPDALTVNFTEQKALVAQFIKAASLQAAGIGIGGVARLLYAAAAVHMAQRQIRKAAFGDLLHRYGAIAAVLAPCLAVQHAQMQPSVRRGNMGQRQLRRRLAHKGRAVYHAAVLGKRHALHGGMAENMYIFRPHDPGIGAALRVIIVVTRRNHHLTGKAFQLRCQQLACLSENRLRVKQVPAQQHQLRLMVVGVVHQPRQILAALTAALHRLLRRQRTVGAVQMEVGCM